MNFKFAHCNLTVTDLERSVNFYKTALNLQEHRRKDFGNCIMAYLRDCSGDFELELKYEKFGARKNLGDNPTHIAFVVDDYESALALHRSMTCITFTHEDEMHFIKDPDGYELEVMSKKFLAKISEPDIKETC